MKLSEALDISDKYNLHPDVTVERAKLLEDAVIAMCEAGWLNHGCEGMSDEQQIVLSAYRDITEG